MMPAPRRTRRTNSVLWYALLSLFFRCAPIPYHFAVCLLRVTGFRGSALALLDGRRTRGIGEGRVSHTSTFVLSFLGPVLYDRQVIKVTVRVVCDHGNYSATLAYM